MTGPCSDGVDIDHRSQQCAAVVCRIVCGLVSLPRSDGRPTHKSELFDKNYRKGNMRKFCIHFLLFGFSICCFDDGAEVIAQTTSSTPVSLADLETQANTAYEAKRYAESARLYVQAVALADGSQRAGDEYNEACSLAQNGEKDR